MSLLAVLVLLVMLPLSIWAYRQRPGSGAKDEFAAMWRVGPWGKQIITDFFALEVMLMAWMLSHAYVHGTWVLALVCSITMPIFGAMPAAIYWLLAVANSN